MPHLKDLPWRVESVRLTLFLADLAPDAGAGWWEQLAGSAPEETTAKRASGEMIDHGPCEGARLWLNRNALAKRVDWVLYTNDPEEKFPGLGPIGDWLDKFGDLMARWLDTKPADPIRIAFGVTFVGQVKDPAEGYAFLRAALPMITFDDDWSEFMFHVNKKHPLVELAGTHLDGTKVNCLSKWNVAQMSLLQIQPGRNLSETLYAGRIELDLSTIPENARPIGSNQVAQIMSGLSRLAARHTEAGLVS